MRLEETPGNPIVYGEWLGAPGAPTILFYGHYDVQPVDPARSLGVAAVRGDRARRRDVRARRRRRQGPGVHAPQGHRGAPVSRTAGCRSTSRRSSKARRKSARTTWTTSSARTRRSSRADVVVISDSAMFDRGVPSICYSLRGLVYFQIDLRGTKSDLHSGLFGGAVANPAFVLPQILAQMKDRGGRIKIPGLLRRRARAVGRGTERVEDAAVQREEVPQGPGRAEAVRRDRLHHARARLGAGRRSRSTAC